MSDQQPNVVLIVSDDHGMDMGCTGNTCIQTPALDGLAADGVRFTHGFCTAATCSPSRSVILSGLFSHSNGMYGLNHGNHHFSCFENFKSLPVHLTEAGYRTARVGKYHVGPEPVFHFEQTLEGAGRDDVRMSENCREFVQTEEPFFLYWCSCNPHRGGGKLNSHPCRPNRFGNPEQPFDGDSEQKYSEKDVIVPSYLSDTPEVRAELAQYYQSVSRLDRGIGRLLDILKQAGKYENTLIIYVSDNGAAFPESKTTLYEPGMNLPCIAKRPNETRKGNICSGLVSWADLTPTILDAAGVCVAADDFHGLSFCQAMDEENPADWREEVYGAHCLHEITNYYPMRVIRTRRYKFIWNIAHPLPYPFSSDLWDSASWQAALRDNCETFGARSIEAYVHRARFELYDLENDPDEVDNLAGKAKHKARVDAFCEKLKAFQERTRDPWLHKWEYE